VDLIEALLHKFAAERERVAGEEKDANMRQQHEENRRNNLVFWAWDQILEDLLLAVLQGGEGEEGVVEQGIQEVREDDEDHRMRRPQDTVSCIRAQEEHAGKERIAIRQQDRLEKRDERESAHAKVGATRERLQLEQDAVRERERAERVAERMCAAGTQLTCFTSKKSTSTDEWKRRKRQGN
jgi:hypothetical protein